jgi:hypothetical protein
VRSASANKENDERRAKYAGAGAGIGAVGALIIGGFAGARAEGLFGIMAIVTFIGGIVGFFIAASTE